MREEGKEWYHGHHRGAKARKQFLEGGCGQPCQMCQGQRKLRKDEKKTLAGGEQIQELRRGRVATVKS